MSKELIEIKELVDKLEGHKDAKEVLKCIKMIQHKLSLYQEDFLLNYFKVGDEIEYVDMKGVVLGVKRDIDPEMLCALFNPYGFKKEMKAYTFYGDELAALYKTGKHYESVEDYINEER